MLFFSVLIFSVASIIISAFFGRFISRQGVATISTLLILFCFISAVINSIYIYENGVFVIRLCEWFFIETLNISWSFTFDALSSSMCIIILFISTLVHLYSTEYMAHDPHFVRFMCYLSLFTFFMLILVTGSNLVQLFVGWEGVGIASFLLINFWFTRIQANKAAIKAMLVNRVGDFFMLIAFFLMYAVYNSLDFTVVSTIVPLNLEKYLIVGGYEISYVDLICVCLFLGAMGKSAQLGLHTWLPDAMEGPTPVSALIHAATMVTAGVYLVIRCSFIFEYSPGCLALIVIVGSLTAIFAATTGLFQNDMKRVIAYSTCSQLGYMFFACGLSGYDVGFFHLSNHAFFKALLFLCAGSVIHAMGDEQDMRLMGGLQQILPFTFAGMLIGSLALIGFPYLAGFYSKDIILEIAAATHTMFGQFSYILGLLAAFCTAFYSTRLLFLVFLAEPNGLKTLTFNVHEGSWRMTLPLFLLSFLSITIGYLTKDLLIGFGTDFWGSSIFVLPINYKMLDIEFLSFFVKIKPLVVTLAGVLCSYYLYSTFIKEYFNLKSIPCFIHIVRFFNKRWYIDRVYNEFVSQTLILSSYTFFYKDLDRGFLEFFGPSGIIVQLPSFFEYLNNKHFVSILVFLRSNLIHFGVILAIIVLFNV